MNSTQKGNFTGIPGASAKLSWPKKRLKYIFRERVERSKDGTEEHLSLSKSVGLRPRTEISDRVSDSVSLTGYRVCYHGDLVMNKMQAWNGVFGFSRFYGIVSPDYTVFEPTNSIDARFYSYLFSCVHLIHEFRKLSKGIGTAFLRLYSEDFGSIYVPLPPLPTQKAIANFLDRKTAAIDALLQKKQKLLALLKEKRAALINQAVTKGLDPNVPMKDSGIPWIGEIPAHWSRVQMKRGCSSIRDGTHNPPPRSSTGVHRLLSARNIKQGQFVLLEDDRRMTREAFNELERSYTVCAGDILLACVGATTGKSAVVGDVEDLSVQRSLAILRPNRSATNAEYLNLWISCVSLQNAIRLKTCQYAAQGGIYLEDVSNLPLILPSLLEQNRILESLTPTLIRAEKLCRSLLQSAERLSEYRQALITAAVTGQIDVSVAENEPEELTV